MLTKEIKLKLCTDLASGMVYLSRRGYVHRDLAARNALLSSDYTCKVADFGLSRSLHGSAYYRPASARDPVPVRWAAVEVLEQGRFSSASDVWSFGVTMVEVWQDGATPFGDLSNTVVWAQVVNGMRLAQPPSCPEDVFHRIICPCWNVDPEGRPTFAALEETLAATIPQLMHLTQGAQRNAYVSDIEGLRAAVAEAGMHPMPPQRRRRATVADCGIFQCCKQAQVRVG